MNEKNLSHIDENFMREALVEAKLAAQEYEVPVGAICVFEGEVIARARNGVEQACDASKHAELVCLQRAAGVLRRWRLTGCTLYSTLEPCSMCAGALALFRIDRLVYGANDLRHGACGTVFDILDHHPIHKVERTSGVLEGGAKGILQDFFKRRRESGYQVVSGAH